MIQKFKAVLNIMTVTVVVCIGLSTVQCTPKPQVVKADEEAALRARVQEYWEYRLKGQWDKSYLYESPEVRENLTIVGYIRQNGRSPVKWEEADILEVWTSGSEGHVKINTKYRYLIPQTKKAAFDRIVEEQWVKKEGQWYRLSSKSS